MDWHEIENQLFEHCCEALRRFSTEHPDETCSFLAYDVDLPYFVLTLDTPAHALAVAQRTEQEAIARRAKMLNSARSWMGAKDFSTSPPVLDYSYRSDLFAFYDIAQISIDALGDVEVDEGELFGETIDEFVEGHVRIVLWRVIERLIASDELYVLRLSTLFRLGYQLHDDRLNVVRILNWPSAG